MSIQLKTIGLIARDLSKTVAFYRELGFDLPVPQPGVGNVDLALPNGVVLGFLSAELAAQADARFELSTAGAQLLNLQFLCDSAEEVDAVFARLIGAGYAAYAPPWDAPWGQRFARVTDPDGRIVNLYAPVAR